jgi:uncharacterized protein
MDLDGLGTASVGVHLPFPVRGANRCTVYIHARILSGVDRLRFDWDPRKASANRAKHGVTFEEALTVFADEAALLIHDPDHSDDEERFVLLGMSALLRVLVVVHCHREAARVIRIISARRATRSERRPYFERRA